MSNFSAVNESIREQLFNNIPTGILDENVAWPNMPFDPENLKRQISVSIGYVDRERVTLGVGSREYRVQGTVLLSLFSPRDTHTAEHDTIVDQMIGIYDELILPAGAVTIEFLETRNFGSSVDTNFWRSDIATSFYFHEFL